ncbi:MAG TPA: hypothetical protein VK484_12565 [Ferruginibacter sp.]|nr:hypothetical protein [Ferruginibacter sp.]
MIQKKLYPGENILAVSKKQETSLNLFWYGLTVYMVFFVLAVAETTFFTAANCQAVQIVGFIAMAIGGSGLIKFKFDNKYLEILFILNLLYSVSIILRGSTYDKDSLKQMFLDPTFGVLPYFAAVVVLFPRNIGVYKRVFSILVIFGAFFIAGSVMFYDILHDYDRLNLKSQGLVESIAAFLGLPVGYILFNSIYFGGKKSFLGIGGKNIFAILVILITLFFAIFRARRGLIFMCACTAAAVAMIYIMGTKKKALIIAVAVLFAGASAIFITSMQSHSMFSFLSERGEEDTRTGVEVWMYGDMSTNDWIIGKGIKGKYYCPIVENVNDAEGAGYRDSIETGYLQIILKGGIINLALVLAIFLPAIYFGLFKSKNVLSKAAAMWLFLWIVYLYPAGGIVFSMNYILAWIAVGICYSEKIRSLPDTTIKNYLQTK